MAKKMVRKHDFSSKMHNGENAFEVLLYIYINNASITPKYRNGFILESCHIRIDSLIISLHGNVNNSKFIKTNIPLNFDQHPPLKHNDVAAREEVV